MLVIGVAGSPRKEGNSSTLMRAALQGAASAGAKTREIHLNDLAFKGCQGCGECTGGGGCILADELTRPLSQLKDADGWVLATPIYYDSVSGQMKTFFDRCRTFTRDPDTHKMKPQLRRARRGVVIATYEDKPRSDYLREAEKLSSYLRWMGDFEKVEVICEGNLGPRQAARENPELLSRAESIGRTIFSSI